jgi:ubiquinone biosynthesis accessory factor UbiJ
MIEARVNEVLNRALAESAKAQGLSSALAGRLLHVVVSSTKFAGSLRSEGATVRFAIGALPAGTTADATISGSALSLAGLMSERQRELIHGGAVQISGDGEIAARFSELATLLKPDVEHELSRLFGRMPAHLLVGGVRGLLARGRALFDSQLHTAADYLAHEKQTLVPKAEAEHYFKQVDSLREQVDRVDARLLQLERRP